MTDGKSSPSIQTDQHTGMMDQQRITTCAGLIGLEHVQTLPPAKSNRSEDQQQAGIARHPYPLTKTTRTSSSCGESLFAPIATTGVKEMDGRNYTTRLEETTLPYTGPPGQTSFLSSHVDSEAVWRRERRGSGRHKWIAFCSPGQPQAKPTHQHLGYVKLDHVS